MTLFEKLQLAKQKKIDENIAIGNLYLEKNAKTENVISTNTGLQYKVLEKGNGTQNPSLQNTITCHYKGTLIDETEFDSSYKNNKPSVFEIFKLIKGMQEGLQLMTVNSKFCLYIPSHLAYGNEQIGAIIKPGSALIFEVTLLQIH